MLEAPVAFALALSRARRLGSLSKAITRPPPSSRAGGKFEKLKKLDEVKECPALYQGLYYRAFQNAAVTQL